MTTNNKGAIGLRPEAAKQGMEHIERMRAKQKAEAKSSTEKPARHSKKS
jgi:hypothetical protein